ncbi:MAG: hypothetical protein KAI67_05270 [Candidatus Pacebacteria bacterium]|nr:hypothetical protein [Candidatus Paceibacterota bacterium]
MENNFQIYLKKNEKTIGSIASVLTTIMFLSLIEIFLSNIRGDSNIIIQPLATVFTGFFWSLYAYSRKDIFLLVPNSLGFVLGIITVVSVFI